MVFMSGDKRVLDKTNTESDNSTSSKRKVDIFGISSYSDIVDQIIPIKATSIGSSGTATLDINNLGAINISMFDNGVLKTSLNQNWVSVGETYYISYNGSTFVLVNRPSSVTSGDSSKIYNISLDSDLGLLNIKTTTDIVEIGTSLFGVNTFDDVVNSIVDLIELTQAGYTIRYMFPDGYKELVSVVFADNDNVSVLSFSVILDNVTVLNIMLRVNIDKEEVSCTAYRGKLLSTRFDEETSTLYITDDGSEA